MRVSQRIDTLPPLAKEAKEIAKDIAKARFYHWLRVVGFFLS